MVLVLRVIFLAAFKRKGFNLQLPWLLWWPFLLDSNPHSVAKLAFPVPQWLAVPNAGASVSQEAGGEVGGGHLCLGLLVT